MLAFKNKINSDITEEDLKRQINGSVTKKITPLLSNTFKQTKNHKKLNNFKIQNIVENITTIMFIMNMINY
ncbi:hypothetical protein [Mycoplasmopsis cynos]|uniref:Uncharacterized protein n=1 Tax=Mycoplasmopsis cynos TaxID=171284 RepID=A0A449AIQ0_9BACT|nr:hypothetical protein [Mycoplasmopsis cynos]VEU64816.1 Uncharacterised protein [Mycoplasmopsis cynos]